MSAGELVTVPPPAMPDFDDILAGLSFGGRNPQIEWRRLDVARLLAAGTPPEKVCDLLNEDRPADAQLRAETIWDDIAAVAETWRQQARLNEGDALARLLAYHWSSMAQLASDREAAGDAKDRTAASRTMVEVGKEIARLMGIPTRKTDSGWGRVVVEGNLGRTLIGVEHE